MVRLPDLARRIQKEHRAASDAASRAVQHARAAGQLLISAKQQLKHGAWLPWLREHCHLSTRAAQCYMQLARLSKRDAQRVADLSLREALRAVATSERQVSVSRPVEERAHGALGVTPER